MVNGIDMKERILDTIHRKGYTTYAVHPDENLMDSRTIPQRTTVMMYKGQPYTILPKADNPADSQQVIQAIDAHAEQHGTMHPVIRTKEHPIVLRGLTVEERVVILHTLEGDRRVDLFEALDLMNDIGRPNPYEHLGVGLLDF